MLKVKFKRLDPKATVPGFSTENSAGADLYALSDGDIIIEPGETVMIHTGICLEIPEGYVGLIYARSGIATKRGLAPANKVGVIDSDYRGEIMISLFNHSSMPQKVSAGERVAQIVITPYLKVLFDEVDELSETVRGNGGFGSTGKL